MNLDINGKSVRVVINFENYSLKKYLSDFKDLLKYQNKKEETDTSSSKQFDLKRIFFSEFKSLEEKDVKNYLSQKFSYEDFQKHINVFVPKILLFLFKDHREIITSEDFEIQVKILRIANREYYGAYDPEISDKDHAYVELSGLWLLNSLIVPYVLYRKMDFGLVYKFLAHELYHHADNIARAFIYEDKLQEKWNLKSKEMSHYGTLFLFCTLLELRVEGYAEFAAKEYRTFVLDPSLISEFRKNLWTLTTIIKKSEAESFFDKKLSTESYATYYCGNVICFFIALYLSKNNRSTVKIVNNRKEFPLSELSSFMASNKKVTFIGLSTELYQRTLTLINQMGPIEFLNTYNLACNDFGLAKENRVLSWEEFTELKNRTIDVAERQRKSRASRKGYMV